MGDLTIGLLHPGEMGAAVGRCLAGAGLPGGFHRAAAEIYRRAPRDGGLAGLLSALISGRLSQQGPSRSDR